MSQISAVFLQRLDNFENTWYILHIVILIIQAMSKADHLCLIQAIWWDLELDMCVPQQCSYFHKYFTILHTYFNFSIGKLVFIQRTRRNI